MRFSDGSEGARVWMELQFPFVCNIVPVLPSGDIVFVEVYRHPVKRWVLELPGGLGEKGESPDLSALRELKEETGLDAGRITRIGLVNVDPGLLARGCLLNAKLGHAALNGPGHSAHGFNLRS